MKKIIIIGAGFAGLSAVSRLSKCGLDLDIILFDKREHSDFLPLIPDCIGRNIDPELLTCNIKHSCQKLKIKFIKEEISSIDLESKQIFTLVSSYSYDFLIIASGSQTNFFSNQGAEDYSFPLNNVDDVRLLIKELDKNKSDNFIICGGGYTGIEVATNLWLYFKKKELIKKIIIVERSSIILGPLPNWMRVYVEKNLKNLGIGILTNSIIENIQDDRVVLSTGDIFNNSMLIWVPGVRTADFITKLTVNKNPQGRLVVDEYLKINPNCFCAGDAAFFDTNNNSLRMAIQFAITQGEHVAKNIVNSIRDIPLKKYRPLDLGFIIPMANNKSCGRVFGLNVKGVLPTLLHFMMCFFRLRGGGRC